MAYENIALDLSDGVATITLDRPDSLNSFTIPMHHDLADAMGIIENTPDIRSVLITGAGRAFCAGQDLEEVKDESDLGRLIDEHYNPLVRRIANLPKPIVCAVNGVAAGAGANLALACDLVVAARSARFVQAFAKIGLVPDSGGTWFLPRRVGVARALGLALLGEALPAEQAADWGLIWKVVDDEALMEEAGGLAKYLATQPTRGLAMTKEALARSMRNDLDTQLDLERDFQRAAGYTADYREGVAAFLEKRAPVFKGH